jgi:dihydroneopterin aldolase
MVNLPRENTETKGSKTFVFFVDSPCQPGAFAGYLAHKNGQHHNRKFSMDIVFLGGLAIDTVIGIYDWERENRQTVILDIEMAFDIQKAAETDDIRYALDYKTVSDRIIAFVKASEFFLVERLIAEVADIIRTEFNVPWVKITLNKKGAIGAGIDVGITIERGAKTS